MTAWTILPLLFAQGVAPDWELKPKVLQIAEDVLPLKPLLEQIDPSKWTVPGGPEGYIQQLKSSLAAIDHMQEASQRLAATPAKLTLALDALLRMEHLVSQTQSLCEGLRRYQNPAVAEVVESVLVKPMQQRDWLRTHVTELAATREKELELAEKEAQRCREQTLRQGVRK